MENNTIKIAFATNKNYTKPLIVAINSLLKYTDEFLDIHVLHSDLSVEDQKQLKESINNNNHELNFHFFGKVELAEFDNLVINGHITAETYYRILIPEIFAGESKILYLDCDILVRRDIKELWDMDFEGADFLAVTNYYSESNERLNIPVAEKYFNAGVMLFDIKSWRENGYVSKVLKFIKENHTKLYSWDQDALNAVLWGKWKAVEQKWNVRNVLFEQTYDKQGLKSREQLEDIANDPYIIHFTGALKPWHRYHKHPFKEIYLEFYNQVEPRSEDEDKVIVFGTGEKARQFVSEGINVDFYVDNNPEKWMSSINGVTVYNPSKILDFEHKVVVIASQFYDEISKQLIEMGLKYGNEFLSIDDYINYLKHDNKY